MSLPVEPILGVDLEYIINGPEVAKPSAVTNFIGYSAVEYDGQDGNVYHFNILQVDEEAVGRVSWVGGPLITLQIHGGQPKVGITVYRQGPDNERILIDDLGEWIIYGGDDDIRGGLHEDGPPMLVRPALWDPENADHWKSLPTPSGPFIKTKT